jgi:hypothetical protein
MNNENRQSVEITKNTQGCTSQTSKIVNSALASVSERTAAKLLKLGLTRCR